MKKLLGMFVLCLLAVPAMAFYEDGEKILLELFDGSHELTCKESSGRFQECTSAGDMIRLLIHTTTEENKDNPEQEVYYHEEIDLIMRYFGEDQKLNIQNTRECKVGNAPFVLYAKTKWADEPRKGMIIEFLSKTVPGKGAMRLQRYHNPEPDEDMNTMKLFKEEDLDNFCEMKFPEE